jgi:uncharacterized protein YggE
MHHRTRPRALVVAALVATLAVVAFVTLGASGSAGADPAPGNEGANPVPSRTVTGTGTGTVTGIPDTMTLQLGVESRGKSVGDALGRNSSQVGKLLLVLADAGVATKDVQTSNFSISPETDEDTHQVTGYVVSNTMTVTLRDLGKVGDIVDRAVAVAPEDIVVDGVSFTIDDNSKLVAAARAAAVKEARDQAAQLAAAAGVELGDLQTITETSEPTPRPLPTARDSAGTATVPVEPGTQQLSVVVSVVYAIK